MAARARLTAAAADSSRMEVQAAAAMSILSTTVQGAHDAMERANVKALPAMARRPLTRM
jgi:hypothetical protein